MPRVDYIASYTPPVGRIVTSAHLPQSRDTWFHSAIMGVVAAVSRAFFGHNRPWSDDAVQGGDKAGHWTAGDVLSGAE